MRNLDRVVLGFVTTALIAMTGCRSDADQMAEFCLKYEVVSQTNDCTEMASQLEQLLADPQPRLRDTSICDKTTACLPCKKAILDMLRKCGRDEKVSEIMKTQMHFSTALRDQMSASEEENLPF